MGRRNPEARRAYLREYQRQWVAQRRAMFFKSKTCECCGSKEDLQLDHKDPRTKITSSIWSWRTERRNEEIAKCQVLCKPCHQKKTWENKENARGERIGTAKLNDSLVREIRQKWVNGSYTKRGLAREYGVDEKLIRLVVAGEIWQHVEG